MSTFPQNIALNLPTRKIKGLYKMWGGLTLPFYFRTIAGNEASPVKVKSSSSYAAGQVNFPKELDLCVDGNSDGARCIGLTMQITYDDALAGQMGQLQGWTFPNDTAQRLDNSPIGVLGGQGYAVITNYIGNPTVEGFAYVGPSGFLKTSGASGDKLPVVFETSGTGVAGGIGGTPVRIRFDFPLAVVGA